VLLYAWCNVVWTLADEDSELGSLVSYVYPHHFPSRVPHGYYADSKSEDWICV
jgi:hypothetical protein